MGERAKPRLPPETPDCGIPCIFVIYICDFVIDDTSSTMKTIYKTGNHNNH
jgi:hypothetical protein